MLKPFEELKNQTIGKIAEILSKSEKKELQNLKMYDLISYESHILDKGVYLFYDEDNKPLYVGKNSAMSFSERMGYHFNLREGAWMNSFLTSFKNSRQLDSILEASEEAKKCKIVLIPFNNDEREHIKGVEIALQMALSPQLNPRPHYRGRNLADISNKTLIEFSEEVN